MAHFRRTAFLQAFLLCLAAGETLARAQEPADKPAVKADEPTAAQKESPSGKPELPFQIQLLETRVRFEANGDSRKEVHTIVKINNILGAHQFARLAFDYNRAFQQVEIPLVRVSHANGGTSEVLPSAVVDAPNVAVEKFPAYQDVRVKSVRILGLQDGDTVEYRVITTTTKHPLAPDFWLEHTFDHAEVVSQEVFEIDVPASRKVQLHVTPEFPYEIVESENRTDGRVVYRWHRPPLKAGAEATTQSNPAGPDVIMNTFRDWGGMVSRIAPVLQRDLPVPEVVAKSAELSRSATTPEDKFRALYEFVSQKILTVDLPLGTTGFRVRPPLDIISSGYGIPEEKCALLSILASGLKGGPIAAPALALSMDTPQDKPPRISALSRVLMEASLGGKDFWLDPSLEVAPFGLVTSDLRGKFALRLVYRSESDDFDKITRELPFAASQKVNATATLASNGDLVAKVHYSLRGDNELLLRVAFHQTPKEKWKDVAGLLALSDGFRGRIASVNASDPTATKDPFTLEYELTQEKFVDWTKKPVRIPALLPQIGLPDLPTAGAPEKIAPKIELGTPLDVQTSMTLRLPAGTTIQTPAGTSMARDYATYASKYSSTQNTVLASRHIHFLKREIPGDRALDYNAFVQAVQTDQAQRFVLAPANP